MMNTRQINREQVTFRAMMPRSGYIGREQIPPNALRSEAFGARAEVMAPG
jgi:hypothetical protein